MGYISSETISLIRDKTDIISVIGEYVHLISSGRTYKALCPFHKEKTPSFHVLPDKQIYHCFGCGKGGDVFAFLMELEHLTFPEVVRFLAAKCGVEIPKDYDPEAERHEDLYNVLSEAADYYEKALYSNEGKIARDYLKQRNITEETAKKFRIGFAPDSWDYITSKVGKNPRLLSAMEKVDLIKKREKNNGYYDTFRNRLMIPILDVHGRVAGFGGRVFSPDQEPKYLNSAESETFNKRKMLFNFREALPTIRRQNEAIVVEGYMDVISLWQNGITNAVASLGTAIGSEQIQLLARNSKTKDLNLYFCYDADEPGQKATIRAISVQKDSPINARVVVWDHPELYKDPDEYIKGEGVDNFKKMLEKAEDIYTFLVKKRTRGMKPPFEIPVKEKLIQEFKELVLEIQSPIAKSEVIRKLSKLLDIEPNILEKEFESNKVEGSEFSKKAKKIVSPELNAEIQRQEWILKYLLEQPEEIEMVKSMLNADDFTDSRLRVIYETICSSQEAAGGTLKPAEILAMLDNEELVSRLSELITTLEDRPEVPFKECIQGLIRRRLETKLKLLQKRIRDAEDSGDDLAIAQISMEQLEVKRQFDVLVNSH